MTLCDVCSAEGYPYDAETCKDCEYNPNREEKIRVTNTEQAAYDAAEEIDKLKAEVIYWREMAERLMKATMNIANVADLMFDYKNPELF